MNRMRLYLKKEKGSILFYTLLILVMMAAAGFTMISNSLVESNIVRNASSRTLNFYASESATMEAAQRLDNISGDSLKLLTLNEPWLNPNKNTDPILADINVPWDFDGSAPADNAQSGDIQNTAFTIVQVGKCPGESLLEVGGGPPTSCWHYNVLGRYYDPRNPNNPIASVGVGFLKEQKNF